MTSVATNDKTTVFLRPIDTKKDNYDDNCISVHTNAW